ncbi:cytoglobin-1-like [Thalassophryne amazonica]|uniref:cytoglobin-1-like n=1 Tax=Thalassophryne amazonica TaxID=390379 RepID=UPI0014708718|nr:cytoglobin-1-like [Thalassophryne amazonica]
MERMQDEGLADHLERASPLTDKEKTAVQEIWAKVFINSDDVGVAILVRFFTKYPKSKQYFNQFKDSEVEELKHSAQFRKHAGRVMNALNTMVESLDNSEKLESLLKLIGKSHALRHKVEPVYFKKLSEAILEILEEAFPEVKTTEVRTAWIKLLAVICCGVSAVYEEEGWTKLSTSTG